MSLKRVSSLMLLLMLAAIVGACDVDTSTTGPTPSTPSLSYGATPSGPATLNQAFLDLGEQIPGFAGFYFDEDGNALVQLKDMREATRAAEVLTPILAQITARDKRGPGRVLFRHAKYDFREMMAWHNRLIAAGLHPQVTMTDVDEEKNRIWIGVEDALAIPEVRASARQVGIPPDAIEVGVAARMRRFSGRAAQSYLSSYQRPVVGGIKIESGTLEPCTLGASVRSSVFSTTTYLLTASHCSTVRGPDPGTPVGFYQPDQNFPFDPYIGEEALDPAYFDSRYNSSCPAGKRCRWSDALLSLYPSWYVNGQDYWFGYFAMPVHREGSTEVSGYFTIRGREGYSYMNQTVEKVGYSTGWTHGKVAKTCYNANTTDYRTGVQYTYLCQDFVVGTAWYGDSGGPVFYWDGFDGARLVGIVMGGEVDSAGTRYWVVSPLSNIDYDMGFRLEVN